jgi:hypothetical protein
MTQITPKHLAREIGGIDAKALRALLRARYGTSPTNRWRWSEREAAKIKKWLTRSLGMKNGGRS